MQGGNYVRREELALVSVLVWYARKLGRVSGIGLLISLLGFSALLSGLEGNLLSLQIAKAQDAALDAATQQENPTTAGTDTDLSNIDLKPTYYQSLQETTAQLATTAAAERRIELNAIDRTQFETYLKVERYLHIKAMDTNSDVQVNDLPAELREELNLDRLSMYDRRIIRSILNEVTPEAAGGAGREFIKVARLTKDHRTESRRLDTETIPPEEDEQRESQHYRENGKAIDVSELDYLRGTKFTIETEVDEKGRPVLKDGKPVEKVIAIEHLPAEGIQFAWQSDDAANLPGTLPEIFGASPHEAGQRATEEITKSALAEEADRAGAELGTIKSSGFTNVAQLSKDIGVASLNERYELPAKLGRHAPVEIAQEELAKQTGLPELSWRGKSMQGAESLPYYAGSEAISQRLGLPGAVDGPTSKEVMRNIGERLFEKALGDLPLGTLNNVRDGDAQSVRISTGRGVIAKYSNLWVNDLLAVNNTGEFTARNPILAGAMRQNPKLYDNLYGLSGGQTEALMNGTLAWDSYLAETGSNRLKLLEQYQRKDTALNLGESTNLINKTADDLVGIIQATERGLTDLFLAGQTGVFVEVGIEHVVKVGAKDNDERAALRSYLRNGSVPVIPGTQLPAVNLDHVAGRLGFRSRIGFDAVFRTNGVAPALETVGRLRLVEALVRDAQATANGLTQAAADTATLTQRLDGIRSALEAIYRQAPRENREAITRALATTDQLRVLVNQVSLLDKAENSEDWVNGLSQLYEVTNQLAGSPLSSSAEYRDLAIAAAKLADNGDAGEALYQVKDRIRIGHPAGQVAVNEIIDVVANKKTPTEGFKAFGAYGIDQAFGSKPGAARLLYEVMDTVLDSSQPPSEGELRAALLAFAKDNQETIAENALSQGGLLAYATDLDGAPLPAGAKQEAIAAAMVALLAQPAPTQIKHGAEQLSTGLGIAKYELGTGTGVYGALSAETGAAVDLVVKQAMADAKTMELITGRLNLRMSAEQRQKKMLSAMIIFAADETGLPIHPAMFLDPDYEFTADEALFVLDWAARTKGTTLERMIHDLNIPVVGDILANRETLRGIITGQIFDTDSEFWADGSFARQLDAVAAKRGVPPGMVRALLDKNLTDEQREAAIKDSFRGYLTTRLNAELINDVFGLEGTDAALTAQGLAGIVNILLDDDVADKEGAFRELGLSIGDAYFTAHYGFQISWMFDQETSIEQKGRIGLRTLSTAMGLDPAITELADTFYEVLLLDGQLNLDTAEGKANVAKLVTSFGNAAGVPGEYTVLAAATLTGDLETTLVTYAGQSYIDRELTAFGITDIGFTDIYEAFVAPLPDTKARAWNDAYEFMVEEVAAGSEVGVVGGLEGRPGTPGTFADIPTTELTKPDGTKVLVWQNEADFVAVMAKQREQELRQERQRTVQYAVTDALLAKALGSTVPGASIRGFSRAMMEGSPKEQLRAFEGLLIQMAGSSDAALLLGSVQLAQNLSNFFGSNRDLEEVDPATFAQFDSWLAQSTGWDFPPGTTEAIFAFMKTGNTGTDVLTADGRVVAQSFDTLLSSDYTKFQLSGYLDRAVGLPDGTTFTIWRSYEQYEKASTAYTAAKVAAMAENAELIASLSKTNAAVGATQEAVAGAINANPITGGSLGSTGSVALAAPDAAKKALEQVNQLSDIAKNDQLINATKALEDSAKKAADANQIAQQKLQELQLTMAGIVSTGVNLMFGQNLAQVDRQLGLPSGTASLLATTAIYAMMVPGITMATLWASVLMPGLGALLIGGLLGGGGFFGIGGKKRTQKAKRTEILWSYQISKPGTVAQPISAETGASPELTAKEREERTNLFYKKMTEAYNAKPEEQRKLYTPKPALELARGEWPEEVWYPDPKKPGANPLEDPANVNIVHPGIEIAFVKDEELPAGVFRGNTKEQFLAGAKQAADAKIITLIGDLLSLPERLADDEMLPSQIWTHDEAHLRAHETLINAAYGDGAIGSYQDNLDDGQRKGVGYDQDVPLLTQWIHWQY